MKQFGSLVLAAILGSTLTFVGFQWRQKNGNVTIEHVQGAPVHSVGYTVNEKGEMVPLDFTGTEK